MNFDSVIFSLDGLCSAIFLIIFFITYRFPPKKINSLYGYRTSRSMKNQNNWEFAQSFSSIQFLKSSVVLLLVSLIRLYLDLNKTLYTVLAFAFLALSLAYPIYKTETALKQIEQHEEDNQNR